MGTYSRVDASRGRPALVFSDPSFGLAGQHSQMGRRVCRVSISQYSFSCFFQNPAGSFSSCYIFAVSLVWGFLGGGDIMQKNGPKHKNRQAHEW